MTYDGDNGMWEVDRGAFLFLMDEPRPHRRVNITGGTTSSGFLRVGVSH